MKKYFLLLLVLNFLTFNIQAQDKLDISKINTSFLKFLPSNKSASDLRPSDIPSSQVLKQIGLSDSEIQEALDFKYSRGNYSEIKKDTNTSFSSLQKLYSAFDDTLIVDSTSFPKAKIFGQDIFRNQDLSFFQKALDAKAPENYKVGPGDEISISIWGFNEFSETLEVDERGYISPSSYGRIYVKGITFKNMRSILKKKFSTFFDMQNSEIDVSLSYSRVITVNIIGEVYNPGSFTIPAINTAFNALIASGGPNQIGSVRNVYIKRDGKTVDSLDVYKFLFDPQISNDIYMQDGDYIFIPPAKNIVEIIGEVNRPYTYEAKDGESVGDMIKYSGGFTTTAFRDILTLKRLDYNNLKVYDVNKADINIENVLDGDQIVINKISNKISNVVTVKGDVGVSGDYEFKENEKVLDLLNRAKCISNKTFLEKVYIIRLNEDRSKQHLSINLNNIISDPEHDDNILLNEFDIIHVLSVDEFDDEFFISVQGAVRSAGTFSFGNGMNLQSALILSGGVTQQAQGSRVEVSRIMEYDIATNKLKPRRTVVKNIEIGNDLVLSESAEDFILQPFDQVFVRSNPEFEPAENITILGEVKYPGTYSILRKNEKVSSLIKRAGGLTNYAYVDGVKMFRKFKVKESISKESLEMNISDDLKKSILNSPDVAAIYANEVQVKSEAFFAEENSTKISKESLDIVYLNLDKALKNNESKFNLVLNKGDSIIIPQILDVVHISGELMNLEGNSISAPFFSRKRANYYVKNFAGGFSKENDRSNTIVVYPNGIAKKSRNFILFKISPKVTKGSTIRVASKNVKQKKIKESKVDWNKQIENAMLKISAILTLWVLVDRVTPQ
ncbi:MAG: SLBB domain-containing protein [Flavobacteriales bacterium]|jgi:polysaccharide export outer membrane protein|nr:SLBB domain-containing protein [Flavobacteriales bacterium]|tara:strand:- start:31494 stop:34022 length:2529 start_codon:yes stop_codon:yes gene_type:complete